MQSYLYTEELLSKEEEMILGNAAKNGCEQSKNRLITSNLKIVPHIAKEFDLTSSKHLDYKDLISIGNLELCKCAVRFDPAFNVKFSSYASHSIRNSMFKELTNVTIHIPTSVKHKLNQINQLLKDNISVSDICIKLNITPSEFVNITESKKLFKYTSLDRPVENSKTFKVTDLKDILLVENNTQNDLKELQESLEYALSKINNRLSTVIRLYFGLDSEPLTLEEIGEKINLSRERVRHLKEIGLKELKKVFDNSI